MLTNRQINERNRFFGKDNYKNCSSHFVTYKSVINENEIILRTRNVFSVVNKDNEVEYMLALSNNQALHLPFWNIAKSAYVNENGKRQSTYLVKINKKYFHARTVCVPFDIKFEAPDDYESLYNEASNQGKAKTKVEF